MRFWDLGFRVSSSARTLGFGAAWNSMSTQTRKAKWPERVRDAASHDYADPFWGLGFRI